MVFFANKDNNRKISKRLLGKGTHMRPFPQPSPARRYKNVLRKAEAVSKKNCATLGVHLKQNRGAISTQSQVETTR